MNDCNIVLAGVGGQGILLAANILGSAAVKEGFNVRVSEIHGMAQRGGAVVCHVRIGEGVHAPTAVEGKADVIVGLEPVEALRNIKFASSQTWVLLNTEPIIPSIVSLGNTAYPSLQNIIEKIRLFAEKIVPIDAADLARKAGSVIAQNTVMLGALVATEKLPMRVETMKNIIRELVPLRYVKMNHEAFELGYYALRNSYEKRRDELDT
ncbi:MAG: indolepyruvate ferredoxin oxidoreductase subunit beta [Candidatus Bathyarchaeota archaeon]|nr:indolepyruvate ferredoxin oxidoreductase subunit beta [Candidatus Bathyarchaeota archaeon]